MTFSLVMWLGWISVANFMTAVLGSSYVCGSTYVFKGFNCSVGLRRTFYIHCMQKSANKQEIFEYGEIKRDV